MLDRDCGLTPVLSHYFWCWTLNDFTGTARRKRIGENPKSEYRNSKQIRNFNVQIFKTKKTKAQGLMIKTDRTAIIGKGHNGFWFLSLEFFH
jgi:hypothetical protein